MVLSQLLAAVSFLHSKNIVHRSISLHNVLIDELGDFVCYLLPVYAVHTRPDSRCASPGHTTLIDFGSSATVPDKPPFLTGMHGAPFFVAPEMVQCSLLCTPHHTLCVHV
jgi:serine/threonine protein kinase